MLFVPTEWNVKDKMLHFKDLHNEIFRNKKSITSHSQIFWRIVKPKGKAGEEHQRLTQNKKDWLQKIIKWIDHLSLREIANEFNGHLDYFAKTKLTPELKKRLKSPKFNWSIPLEDQKKKRHGKQKKRGHYSQNRPAQPRVAGAESRKNNRERVLCPDGQQRNTQANVTEKGTESPRNQCCQ